MASEAAKEKEMLKSDLYGIVGVDRNASDAEIKKAYRTKSRKLHPDRNKAENAAELFHQLQEAHEFLLNPALRAKYNIHLDHFQKREEQKKHLDQARRSKIDLLEKREKEAFNQSQTLARKMINRKGIFFIRNF